MEGGSSNNSSQDHPNQPDQQGEAVRENESSAQLDSAEVKHDEAADGLNFLSDSDLNRLIQEGELEFEVPENHASGDEEVDLVIDGDLYRASLRDLYMHNIPLPNRSYEARIECCERYRIKLR